MKTRFSALTFLLVLLSHNTLFSQESKILIDQNKLDILLQNAVESNLFLDKVQIQIGSYNIEKDIIRKEHLGLITLTGNLNEASIRQIGGDNSIPNFYPRYNIGVSVKLNHLSNVKNKVRLSEQNVQYALKESEEVIRLLEEEVTKKYIEYNKRKVELSIKKIMEESSSDDFELLEKKFAEGDVSLDKYNMARNNYYLIQIQVLDAENNYLQIKTELESLVNTSLEELGVQ